MLQLLIGLLFLGDPTCPLDYGDWPDTSDVLTLSSCITSGGTACITPDAGDADSVSIGVAVSLDAGGTTVPHTPEALSFQWHQISGPEMLTVTDDDQATASVTPTQAGDYVFQVTISWFCRSVTDTKMVTVVDAAPVSLDAELVADIPGCQPVQITYASPGDDRLFVVCRRGTIRIVDNGVLLPTPFLDLPVNSGGSEQGLLGLAFDPDYSENGFFYVNYTGSYPAGGFETTTRIVAFDTDPIDPNQAVADDGTLLLSINQPETNHNGGLLQFGPDGYLYIGMGDGGFQNDNDPDHDECGNGQSPTTLLGKMLRIDVDGHNAYQIPPDNPFIADGGVLDEIWAFGLRNPWRWSFDRLTGDLYIGDVGQGLWEEVDFQPANSNGGENYGWPFKEGSSTLSARPNPGICPEPADHILPVFEYSQGGAPCAVTGGYVYRGVNIPGLTGYYVFGDYCGAASTSSPVRFFTLRLVADTWTGTPLEIYVNDVRWSGLVSSFGEDHQGELYLTNYFGSSIYKITGIRE